MATTERDDGGQGGGSPGRRRRRGRRGRGGGGDRDRPTTAKLGDLEPSRDLAFQRKVWRVERAAWVGLALVLLAALAGLFGEGPLSDAVAEAPGGRLRLEYDRFARRGAETELRLRIAASDREPRLTLDHGYLDAVEVRAIEPEPAGAATGREGREYRFELLGDGPGVVILRVRPRRAGTIAGRFGLVDGPSLRFRQWVHP